MTAFIKIKGAAEHNLKNISVKIPVGKLTLIMGDSGSGKSSLAFDVLYAEAKRRYLAALTGDSRNMPRPRVQRLEPVLAAVALEQNCFNRNSRSTVGTFTGLLESLRGIYKLAGEIHCRHCGAKIDIRSSENVVEELQSLQDGSMVIIKAPLKKLAGSADLRQVLRECFRQGFVRLEIAGRIYYLEDILNSDSIPVGKTFVIIDRIVKKTGAGERISDSLKQALDFSRGIAQIEIRGSYAGTGPVTPATVLDFTEVPYCFACGRGYASQKNETDSIPNSMAQVSAGGLIRKISAMALKDVISQPLHIVSDQLNKWINIWTLSARPEFLATASVAEDMLKKLAVFSEMNLDYLTMSTPIPSLSSGEMLKVRLAAILGRKLNGILYVLDEPLGGLTELERHVVRKKIQELVVTGNTVVVVEHDRILREKYADHVIELGPAAGEFGGQVIYEGNVKNYARAKISCQPFVLSHARGDGKVNIGRKPLDSVGKNDFIKVSISRDRNLKVDSLVFPTGTIVGFCGFSGSGKSALARAIFASLKGVNVRGRFSIHDHRQADSKIDKDLTFQQVWFMDEQLPKGSVSSNIATFTNIYRPIVKLFVRTPSARARGITGAYLSLFKKGGRCERCKGIGVLKIEPEFLPKISFKCDRCSGKRFTKDALSIKYRGLNISELLSMTVSQAATFFKKVSSVRGSLEALERTGLGYLQLGQTVSGLSGGERQRLKLASAVTKKNNGRKVLFILDNPARGLSKRDLCNLINLFYELVEGGHSIILAENNALMLENCGWIFEMGPGSGPRGGRIIYKGPPENRPAIS